jgi:dihydroorotase/N-acyl-D-amino-acid deacylase
MKYLIRICILLFSIAAVGQQYDLLIRNGRVVDGTGNPWFSADVGISGDRITLVGRAPSSARAKRTIDAHGLVVAPGFIDMLGHSEQNLLIDRSAFSKLTQGITTEITGEGGSIAPTNETLVAGAKDYLDHYHLIVDWRDLDGYFRRLARQGAGINIGTYVGATQVRRYVMGSVDRAPTADELTRMEALVDDAMQQGAMGVSSSLIYAPAAYAQTDELVALAKVAARYGGIYATHIRNEGDHEIEALDEAFRISREAGIPVEIWHLKVSGRQNWGRMTQVVAAIEKARAEGLDITADQYPYVASGTSLGTVIPPKYHEGGSDALLARLKDPAVRTEIRARLMSTGGTAENMFRGTGGPKGIMISSVLDPALRSYEGKTIAQIAAEEHKDPLDALMDVVVAGHNHIGAMYFTMNEDDLKYAMRQPWVSVGVDAGAINPDSPLGESKTHPRAYGTFTRILGRYVREQHVLSLEEAIRKFTSLPAQRVGLHDRGLIRPGAFADITVFDPAIINDVASFEDPHRASVGIEYVFVNGVLSLEHGKLTGQVGGRPLRGPGWHGGNGSTLAAAWK